MPAEGQRSERRPIAVTRFETGGETDAENQKLMVCRTHRCCSGDHRTADLGPAACSIISPRASGQPRRSWPPLWERGINNSAAPPHVLPGQRGKAARSRPRREVFASLLGPSVFIYTIMGGKWHGKTTESKEGHPGRRWCPLIVLRCFASAQRWFPIDILRKGGMT
jgi:hypothetical protein